jgi:DNA-binding PadR family transcriptional regulator
VDVKDLCLGALTFGDASGYDIKKFFESSLSHCFLAGYGSIYPALAELTEEKLVTARAVPGKGGRRRKLYRLTDAGRRAFQARLRDTEPQHKVKSEFLVLMFFAHLLPPTRLEALLNERLQEFKRHLDQIQEFESGSGQAMQESPGAQFVCGFGKAVMTAASAYIRTHRRKLRSPAGRAATPRKQTRARASTSQTASRHRGYPNA